MDSHSHNFGLIDWPFADSTSSGSFTTDGVLRRGLPIVLVSHEEDGDWQFLCDTPNDERECILVCLGCMLERDQSLALVADLPRGWVAWRDEASFPWQREPGASS